MGKKSQKPHCKAEELPCYRYLVKIAESLWTDREVGNAAIMVGAGFSKNARNMSGQSSYSGIPLWSELAKTMFKDLYPKEAFKSDEEYNDQLARYIYGNGALKLASEYEVEFHTHGLNQFVKEQISDKNYVPSSLHECLLNLPWADVFTTNYDTLLERASEKIIGSRFKLIETLEQIPSSQQPRIIKLHGSLPSCEPFIITEEHYRTYPYRFAPFVNMVQQALMENTFCLLGFSGDDPNFLQWSGWVRDNLKESTPPIYLCGLLNLTEPQERVLRERKVIPVDLSPLFPADSELTIEDRHKLATEWFLNFLHKAKKPDPKDWPKTTAETRETKKDFGEGLPKVPDLYTSGKQAPLSFSSFRRSSNRFKSVVGDLVSFWRHQRECYPGWVIPPLERIKALKARKEYEDDLWATSFVSEFDSLNIEEKADFFREYFWRRFILAEPHHMDVVSYAKETLLYLDSFYGEPQFAKVKEVMIEVAPYVMKVYREYGYQSELQSLINFLEQRFTKVELGDFFYFEVCLRHLYQLEYDELNKRLWEWSPEAEGLLWRVRKTGLQMQVGSVDVENINSLLMSIREQLATSGQDINYYLLSLEGIAMLLTKLACHSLDTHTEGGDSSFTANFQGRFKELKFYMCNPWIELEQYSNEVIREKHQSRPEVETTQGFDLYHRVVSTNLSSDQDWGRSPWALLKAYDYAGIPLLYQNITVMGGSIGATAIHISRKFPSASLSISSRLGDTKYLDKWLTRLFVAKLHSDSASIMNHYLMNLFYRSVEYAPKSQSSTMYQSFEERQLMFSLESLSRCGLRLAEDKILSLVNEGLLFQKKISSSPHLAMHTCRQLNHFLSRLIGALSPTGLLNILPQLIECPIEVKGNHPRIRTEWFEPFSLEEVRDALNFADRSYVQTRQIDSLFKFLQSDDSHERSRATLRFLELYRANILNEDEGRRLGNQIWNMCDSGVPDLDDFFHFTVLFLPSPERIDKKERFKDFVLESEPQILESFNRYPVPVCEYFLNIVGGTFKPWVVSDQEERERLIEYWTTEQAIKILNKSIAWWDSEKEGAKKLIHSAQKDPAMKNVEHTKKRYLFLIKALASAVIPNLDLSDSNFIVKLNSIFSEASRLEIPTMSAKAVLDLRCGVEGNELAHEIRLGLNSYSSVVVENAIEAIDIWLHMAEVGNGVSSIPSDIIDELVNRAVWRTEPNLIATLSFIKKIVEEKPSLFLECGSRLNKILVALEYLYIDTSYDDFRSMKYTGDSGDNDESIQATDEKTSVDVSYKGLRGWVGLGKNKSINKERIPEVRLESSKLARAIFKKMYSKDVNIPLEISMWRDRSRRDPLPEVRYLWLD